MAGKMLMSKEEYERENRKIKKNEERIRNKFLFP